jgi:hypothetical protein
MKSILILMALVAISFSGCAVAEEKQIVIDTFGECNYFCIFGPDCDKNYILDAVNVEGISQEDQRRVAFALDDLFSGQNATLLIEPGRGPGCNEVRCEVRAGGVILGEFTNYLLGIVLSSSVEGTWPDLEGVLPFSSP